MSSLLVLLLGIAVLWYAQQPRRSIDVSKLGPQVGERVPNFSLTIRPIAPTATATEDTHEVGTPFPGTFVVDRQGRVTSRFFEEFYRERNTAANIMLKRGLNANPIAGTRGSTAHLSINAYQSNREVLIGSRFSLALDRIGANSSP